jgi:hypothetical protein
MTTLNVLQFSLICAIVAVPVLILVGSYRALVDRGSPLVRRSILLLAPLLFGWLAVATWLASAGTFQSAISQPFPYIGLAIFGPIFLGSILMFQSRTFREIIQSVPQGWLVGVQLYRIEGAIFLILYAGGLLPAIFAIPAGYGDVLVGLSAIVIGAVALRTRVNDLVALWNGIGLLDLVIALGTGFLSAPTKYQIFSREAPNVLIGTFPWVMIPIYLVPISILLHLASLSKLSTNIVVQASPPADWMDNGGGRPSYNP